MFTRLFLFYTEGYANVTLGKGFIEITAKTNFSKNNVIIRCKKKTKPKVTEPNTLETFVFAAFHIFQVL